MKFKRNMAITLVSIAQVGLLTIGTPLSAQATTSFSSSQVKEIERIEKVLFGDARNSLSNETRLRAIETNLFGNHKTGTTEKRLSEVKGLVGNSQPNLLMPPMAAQYDTGSGSIHSAPEVASSSTHSESLSSSQKLLEEAMAKYSAGDMQAAKQLFIRVSQLDPNSEDAFFNLGVIAEGEGNMSEALNYYRKAYALNPTDSELKTTVDSLTAKIDSENQAKVAQQQEENRKRQEAQELEQMKRTVASASNDYKAKRYDEAIRKLEGVAAKAPTDPDVQFALGQARRAKGDLKEAKVAFEKAQSIDPASPLYRGAVQEVNNDLYSSNNTVAQDSRPAGEITPFTPAPDMGRSAQTNRGIARVFSGSKVKRALAAGAMGAATGAIYSATTRSSSIKRGALQGALAGALIGFLSGN